MAKKNSKWPIYCDFSHFTSIILPCGRGLTRGLAGRMVTNWSRQHVFVRELIRVRHCNLKSFWVSFPNLLCMLLMTSSGTSSIIAEKIQNGEFIAIFRILRQ